MIIFSDYHSTYDTHPELWGITDAIITGTSWDKSEIVLGGNWVGPQKPIFFGTYATKDMTLLDIVNHKSNIINRCKVDKYFENNEQTVQMLRLMCPNTRIILVKEGSTAI